MSEGERSVKTTRAVLQLLKRREEERRSREQERNEEGI
jgi:hypothetical protein